MPISISQKEAEWITNEIREMLSSAMEIADKVYLITQPIAYDESEHPGAAKKWHTLYPVKGQKGCYISNKSFAEMVRKKNSIMIKTAVDMNVKVIELDNFMKSLIRGSDDYFCDKRHFTSSGAKAASDFIAQDLKL